MAPLTIATFNVENLFARARVLNFKSNDTGTPRLALIDDLKTELTRATFNAAKIKALVQQLKGFASIEDTRGKLFTRTGKLVATGAAEWDGFISLTMSPVSEAARANTARVLKDINADIVCLIEVENRLTLQRFMQDRMGTKAYRHLMCIDGNDTRGIDVAIASRFPLGALRSHIDDVGPNGKPIFSRDCLEVEVLHPSGSIWMLLNHFKSKGYGTPATSNAKRLAQATRVAAILGRYNLAQDRVVVCGDFNDTPAGAPLQPILTVPHLTDVFDTAQTPAADRWTYHYKKNEQIDFLLLSAPLQQAVQSVSVFRRGMWDIGTFSGGAVKPYPSMKDWTEAASDHGAVVARFNL